MYILITDLSMFPYENVFLVNFLNLSKKKKVWYID